MTKRSFVMAVVDYSAEPRLKSKTIPDQSLSILEIVRRYVRGIPVDVVQREPVYSDQTEFDLEKLSRMNFAEKAAFADELKERAIAMDSELRERARILDERARKASEEKQKRDSESRQPVAPPKEG